MCSLITRGGPPSLENPAINYISLIGVPYFNQARVEAKGVDYEINYRKDVDWFGGGESIGVRFLGSVLDERTDINAAGVRTQLEGTFGVVPTPNGGLPERSAVISGNYNRGPLSLSLAARYASAMIIQRTWNTGVTGAVRLPRCGISPTTRPTPRRCSMRASAIDSTLPTAASTCTSTSMICSTPSPRISSAASTARTSRQEPAST